MSDDDESIDWDFHAERPKPVRAGSIKVRLVPAALKIPKKPIKVSTRRLLQVPWEPPATRNEPG